MGLHRALADTQLVGYLLVAYALSCQIEDLKFARMQLFKVFSLLNLISCQAAQYFPRCFEVEYTLSGMD